MNHSITELAAQELLEISGGPKEVATKEAILGTIGIIGGVALVYFVLDPLTSYLRTRLLGTLEVGNEAPTE